MAGCGNEIDERFDGEFDDDQNAPLESDLNDDDSLDETVCPACSAIVSELTDKCPACGEWIVHDWKKRRSSWALTAVVLLAIICLLLLSLT